MGRTSKRSEQEIERLLNGYKQSGLTRLQYCEREGIAVTTLNYYRQSRKKKQSSSTRLVTVELTRPEHNVERESQQASGFTLVLTKGRRIESPWSYAEQELARLIRIVEVA